VAVAVVYAFAVADGLVPVVGAAPYDVLARQLPRLLVARLNGTGDRGIRFFPFLGTLDKKRGFLRLSEMLAPEALASLHRQGEVACLVDGWIRGASLRVRVHCAATLRPLFDEELPFAAGRPLDVLPRIQFEVMGALGWPGRPVPPPELAGAALAWFLVAKDELLAAEANLLPAGDDPLRSARHLVELAAGDAEAQELVVDLAGAFQRSGRKLAGLGELLVCVAAACSRPALLQRIAGLLHAAGEPAATAEVWFRLALLLPERAEIVERATGLLFHQERLGDAFLVLSRARATGQTSLAALAQLVVVTDKLGRHEQRDALCAELLAEKVLPVPVARLLLAFLLEQGRLAEGLRVVDEVLKHDPANAVLWLERGRCCLLLDDDAAAARSLAEAERLGLPASQRRDRDRLARLAAAPGLFAAMQRVEAALHGGCDAEALRRAREVARRGRGCADALLLLGIVRQRLGQDFRAERALGRALQLDPELAEACNRLGILLVGRGRTAEGHALLARAHELQPRDPAVLLHLAQACVLLGHVADGERHLAAAARNGASPEMLAAVRREFFAEPGRDRGQGQVRKQV
jgi:Flp pilus assembly protein TadD